MPGIVQRASYTNIFNFPNIIIILFLDKQLTGTATTCVLPTRCIINTLSQFYLQLPKPRKRQPSRTVIFQTKCYQLEADRAI